MLPYSDVSCSIQKILGFCTAQSSPHPPMRGSWQLQKASAHPKGESRHRKGSMLAKVTLWLEATSPCDRGSGWSPPSWSPFHCLSLSCLSKPAPQSVPLPTALSPPPKTPGSAGLWESHNSSGAAPCSFQPCPSQGTACPGGIPPGCPCRAEVPKDALRVCPATPKPLSPAWNCG